MILHYSTKLHTDTLYTESATTTCICALGLKRIVILVFEYSLGFQTNIPNILFTRRRGKMTILYDKIVF